MQERSHRSDLMFLVLLIIAVLAPPAFGERHALLIGIKDYPHVRPLYGPVNDVRAMQSLLQEAYGFPPGNIRLLLDARATRKTILEALQTLRKSTHPEDFIFIYFSGHGTSFYDRNLDLSLGHSTGALIPYEFNPSQHDPERVLASLIIGRRDLRPIFKTLDQDRRLLVVFDTCFSGNAVRAVKRQKGVPKNYTLNFSELEVDLDEPMHEREPFPYTNLIYISASDESEEALDLEYGGEYDGKPHGALTDALLIGLSGAADTNQDALLTYEELYYFAEQAVQAYGHTPQLKRRGPVDTPVFGKKTTLNSELQVADHIGIFSGAASLQVKPDRGLSQTDLKDITSLPGVRTSQDDYDLLLEQDQEASGGYVLFLSSGDRLTRVASRVELLSTLSRYSAAKELLRLRNADQSFNVRLQLRGAPGTTSLFAGDPISFSLNSEVPAVPVLLDIDPRGRINVLLPFGESAETLTPEVTLLLDDYGRVVPPFGSDFVKLFAFEQEIRELRTILDQGVIEAPEAIRELAAKIRSRSDWASTRKTVVTFPRKQRNRGISLF